MYAVTLVTFSLAAGLGTTAVDREAAAMRALQWSPQVAARHGQREPIRELNGSLKSAVAPHSRGSRFLDFALPYSAADEWFASDSRNSHRSLRLTFDGASPIDAQL